MQKVVSKDCTEIAYTKQGTGPNLVLVDGAFCFRDSGTTPMVMPLLSQHFTVFAYDRRGRGESENPKAPYAVAREIEDLQAIVDVAGGPIYMIGFSSGAALALQAVAKGVKVKKLALFEPPYIAPADKPKPSTEAIQQLNHLVKTGNRSGAVTYFLTKAMGVPMFFTFIMRFMPGVWKKNMSVAHTLPYDLTIMGDSTVPSKLAALIKVPTIVISGSKSPLPLQDAAAAVTKAIPDAKQRVLEGMSHMLKPDLLAPVVTKFFKE